MSTSRLVVALLIVCGLVTFALQNTSPVIPLVFLGVRTVALPLAVWLSGAIALGAITTLLLSGFTDLRGLTSKRPRRRWQVRPDASADRPEPTGFRPPPRDIPREPRREPPRRTEGSFRSSTRPQPESRDTAAADNWEAWGQRTPANQWEDWSQVSNDASAGRGVSRRQRQDREKATNAIEDMSQGWDNSAQDTVYVPPGGSSVEDALDEIAEGWEDWESETPAGTAYSYGYQGREAATRADSIYAPPDDAGQGVVDRPLAAAEGDRNEDWGLDDDDDPPPRGDSSAANTSDGEDGEGVYDADYRVIIPPHRPLEDAEDDRDGTP